MRTNRYVLLLTKDQLNELRAAVAHFSNANLVRRLDGAPYGNVDKLLNAAWEGDEAHELCEFLERLRAHGRIPEGPNGKET